MHLVPGRSERKKSNTAQWKMTRTQDQAWKTGLATPGQEPDSDEDHLLATEDLAPGLQTRSRTRPPPLEEPPETVDELDDDDELLGETKEEDASLSDFQRGPF